MTLSTPRVRHYLQNHKLEKLFIEELGWDRHSQSVDIAVEQEAFTLTAIAEKRGVGIFICAPDSHGDVPAYATRRKIENRLSKQIYEHLVIFTDADQSIQIWQWVARAPGRPPSCREHKYYPGRQSGASLIQKLEAITFSISDEESLTLTGTTLALKDAFDRDKITKRFYDCFKNEHRAFLKFIKGINHQGDRAWYASLMLNRLMFVYFIQKKGFLDNDPDYLQNRLKAVQALKGKGKFLTFYHYFLLTLFHQGFATQLQHRKLDPDLKKLIGTVPYLDGGLFDLHELETKHPDIDVDDEAFEKIFQFFDQYEWHLDNRPLANDREINPDVLGYIFEKYINQKEMGAYYTKEDITEYISKNTIIPYLFDTAQKQCQVAFEEGSALWRLLKEDPDRYIYPAVRKGVIDEYGEVIPLPDEIKAGTSDVTRREGWNQPADPEYALPTETWREHVARRLRCLDIREKLQDGLIQQINDFVTYNLDIRQFAQDAILSCEGPELLRAFYRSLAGHIPNQSNQKYERGISVLDPTCGSGAFLFAALNILEPLYEACLERMQGFIEDLESSEKKHSPRKYEDFKTILCEINRHPNQHYYIYKSIIVNNLFGVDIMPEAVEICKLRLFLKLVAQVDRVADLEPLPDIDFNIRAGNTLVGFVTREEVRLAAEWKATGKQQQAQILLHETESGIGRIEEQAEIVARAFRLFQQMQTKYGMDSKVFAAQKQELRQKLKDLTDELSQHLAREYGVDSKKLDKYRDWLTSHQPFHWFAEFYAIMVEGGFDVIIGNPPYVDYKKVQKTYAIMNYKTEQSRNLYAFTLERSLDLISIFSTLGVIVPISLISTKQNASLRKILSKQFNYTYHSNYAIRPAKLFNGVEQRLTISIGISSRNNKELLFGTKYNQWFSAERSTLFDRIDYTAIVGNHSLGVIIKPCGLMGNQIIEKIRNKSNKVAANYLTNQSVNKLFFHRTPGYWIRFMNFLPYFQSPQGDRSVFHIRELYAPDIKTAGFIGSVMSSTLFFYWFFATGNCRNLTLEDVKNFPVGDPAPKILNKTSALFGKLMDDYKKNSTIKKRAESKYQEFNWYKSKNIVDRIDRELASHYELDESETDFIINYDIKYRTG